MNSFFFNFSSNSSILPVDSSGRAWTVSSASRDSLLWLTYGLCTLKSRRNSSILAFYFFKSAFVVSFVVGSILFSLLMQFSFCCKAQHWLPKFLSSNAVSVFHSSNSLRNNWTSQLILIFFSSLIALTPANNFEHTARKIF